MPLLANRLYLFAEEDATTPWRNEPIRAGLALALTDVQTTRKTRTGRAMFLTSFSPKWGNPPPTATILTT